MEKKETTVKDLRQFGLVLALILAGFAFLHFRKGHEHAYLWLAGFSAVSLAAGVFFPAALAPVFRVFTRVAHALGWFNTRVILIAVYYGLLTPIGLLMRLFGKDLLDKKMTRHEKTYWRKRPVLSPAKESMEKQF